MSDIPAQPKHYRLDLVKDIKFQMRRDGVKLRDLASHLSGVLSLTSIENARSFFRNVNSGYLLGTPYPEPKKEASDLALLAHMLFSIGYSPENAIIVGIKNVYVNFDYPPKNGVKIKDRRILLPCESRPLETPQGQGVLPLFRDAS